MRRRQFLASSGAALTTLLAGCPLGPHVDPGPPPTIDLRPADSTSSIGQEYASDVPADREELLATVAADGTATRRTLEDPWTPDWPVEHEEAYYEVTHEVVDERSVATHRVTLVAGGNADTSGVAIAYEELPDGDRTAIGEERLREVTEDASTETTVRTSAIHWFPEDAESVLVPEQEYDVLTYDGTTVEVDVERADERTLHTYRYEATRVAESASALGTELVETYQFSFEDLPPAERALLDEAKGRRSEVARDDENADVYDSLVERFHEHEPVRDDGYHGAWILRDDGERYWADVERSRDADETSSE